MSGTFDFESRFSKDLPATQPKWSGFAKYNFIGGHNDPDSIPIEGLIEATARVLRRRGQTLATYNQDSGPLGDVEMRQFLSEKLAKYRGMTAGIDEILITSGSGQALELINQVMCVTGDTVIMEEYTYQGAMNRLQARGINIVGAKLDDGGLNIDALAAQLDKMIARGVIPKFFLHNPDGSKPDVFGS